jgi:hypothetical protein
MQAKRSLKAMHNKLANRACSTDGAIYEIPCFLPLIISHRLDQPPSFFLSAAPVLEDVLRKNHATLQSRPLRRKWVSTTP